MIEKNTLNNSYRLLVTQYNIYEIMTYLATILMYSVLIRYVRMLSIAGN